MSPDPLNTAAHSAPQEDYCSRPKVIEFLVGGLHKVQGWNDASLRDISTTPITGFDINPTLGSPAPAFVCHATLVKADGSTTTGRIVVSEGFKSIAWTSDADYQKRAAAIATQFERRRALQKTERDLLARCDPRIKARYDALIGPLANETAEYTRHSRRNETAQEFAAYADHERLIAWLQAEKLQACSQ